MHETTWILAVLAILLCIGFFDLALARAQHASALLFVFEFRQKLAVFMQSVDREVYEWLTMNATRMQQQLGSGGILSFKPPFANYIIPNYVVVPNALMEIRKCLEDSVLARGHLASQYASLLDDAILRHEGTVHERIRLNTRSLLNPLKWLTRGVSVILGLPVWVLQSVGLISESSGTRLRKSRGFEILSGFSTLVGFVSAVVGLVTGWEPFIALARKAMPIAL